MSKKVSKMENGNTETVDSGETNGNSKSALS